jgi:hypothetical protein
MTLAQMDVGISFNSVHIGRNLALTASKHIASHRINVGLKYNINSFEHDNQMNLFKKRFFATEFDEHWGFILGYSYGFKVKDNRFEPFLFYEMQYTYSHTRNEIYSQVGYDISGNELYIREVTFFGPTVALENYIGFGITYKLWEKIILSQKIGGGYIQYFKTDERYVMPNNRAWEFGYMLNIGIFYRFGLEM